MTQAGNQQVIDTLYEAFGRGDIAAVLDLIDPDAELIFEGPEAIPWTGCWRGRDGWTAFFETIGGLAESVAVQMTPFALQGGNAVYLGRYQATVKATGKCIDSPLVHLWTLKEGKVVRCQEVTNTAAEAAAFAA